jgi:hypothetical protein
VAAVLAPAVGIAELEAVEVALLASVARCAAPGSNVLVVSASVSRNNGTATSATTSLSRRLRVLCITASPLHPKPDDARTLLLLR